MLLFVFVIYVWMGVESESDSCLYIRGEKRENEARGTQIEPKEEKFRGMFLGTLK